MYIIIIISSTQMLFFIICQPEFPSIKKFKIFLLVISNRYKYSVHNSYLL